MKVLHAIFVGLLIACMAAMAITMIVRTNQALDRSRAVIAQADDFIAAHERR